jgi:CheY-like chemotaxis protein
MLNSSLNQNSTTNDDNNNSSVLVVDDEYDIVNLIKRSLEVNGRRACVFTDASLALTIWCPHTLREVYSNYIRKQIEDNNEVVLVNPFYETTDSVRQVLSEKYNE